jgi:hypothetical protein
MTYPAFLRRGLPLIGQCALVFLGLLMLYAFPPAHGRLLLLPVNAGARARLVHIAVAGQARLVAAGPVAGSMLVEGRRDRLAVPLLRAGVVTLSAQVGGCAEAGA